MNEKPKALETVPCKNCGGSGIVNDVALGAALGIGVMTLLCPTCGGSGKQQAHTHSSPE